MKTYYKQGQVVARPKSIYHKGFTHLNPSDEVLIEAEMLIIC